MITALASELVKNIELSGRLQQGVSQLDTIRATAEVLAQLHTALSSWARSFAAVEPHFEESQRKELRNQANAIYRRLDDSHERFDTEFAQRPALARVQPMVSKLQGDTLQYWTLYGARRLQPLRQLVAFSEILPEMRGDLAKIQQLAADLEQRTRRLPVTGQDVKEFHKLLKVLESKLSELKGGTAEQAAFLDKILRRAAKLDDLDEGLLAWCKKKGLAALLNIRLGD